MACLDPSSTTKPRCCCRASSSRSVDLRAWSARARSPWSISFLLRVDHEGQNVIWATDLYTTRDRALGVILRLLETDDEVFHREPYYEDAQTRIQNAVCAKLGQEAVPTLKANGELGLNS
ncbi:hypothetical protein ASPZODRAFT_29201 [Penicilliopsis zonata CBS 506.65]|uniref:Uncharacterized protein n=1 Tax=Penicilliopsis zonata CBS 506.65 TaxID=1073090 RepID=A0A1L9S5P7_9EURO|nr:hypothetical protein ASPZODRAFT_29201 [Penicilliopsis zonata CBS 506.65]OJJ42475.1 hypothetical protein ASPZODRAFT_29201 [Penicilliopsis zonata CBS 506.65]